MKKTNASSRGESDMKDRLGTDFRLPGGALAVAVALAVSSPAQALQFEWG
jgi:hypothetical protein